MSTTTGYVAHQRLFGGVCHLVHFHWQRVRDADESSETQPAQLTQWKTPKKRLSSELSAAAE